MQGIVYYERVVILDLEKANEPRPVFLRAGAAIVNSGLEADARAPRPTCSIRNKV